MQFICSFMSKEIFFLLKLGLVKVWYSNYCFFFFNPTGMVIIFILLKVLQAEQNLMINCISRGKAISLTGENNQKIVQQSIWSSDYTHIFTSLEIALFEKLKANILDNLCFARWLYLLAIDEIYLIEEWGKNFWPLYVKIGKAYSTPYTFTRSLRHTDKEYATLYSF